MNAVSPVSDFHEFEVDENIVHDLIYRQNGTISTALRELVMNALDYGSDRVDITIGRTHFEVKDRGKGFEDETSIMQFFKRFGTPHKEGDAKYGRFRIGRGQIMAFAKTTWHSKNFQMVTDIGSGVTGFNLTKDAEYYAGCSVSGSFYKELPSGEVESAVRDLSNLVRYAPHPIFINQVQVNANGATKWDYDDDELSIIFNPKGRYGINLYSQGILVKELHMFRYGTTADIVTKKALQLNMARNEINENDPLWKKVHRVLRSEMLKKTKRSSILTEHERLSLIDQFVCDELGFLDIYKAPLLKDVRGKSSSFYKELGKKRPWTVCNDTQRAQADQVSTLGTAFVLSRSELDLWRVDTVEALLSMAKAKMDCVNRTEDLRQAARWTRIIDDVVIVDFERVASGIHNQYDIVEQKDLTALERAQRNTLQYACDNICGRLSKIRDTDIGKRKVLIGDGPAIAWTDSSTFIAVNREQLSYFKNGSAGLIQLAGILLHELTHQEGSITDNGHDHAFYESFHDAILVGPINRDVLGNAFDSLSTRYKTELSKAGLPVPEWMLNTDLHKIELTLTEKAPNKLLSWFLGATNQVAVTGRSKITLQVTRDRLTSMKEIVDKAVNKLLKAHNLSVKYFSDYTYISDWDVATETYTKERAHSIQSALKKEGLIIGEQASRVLAFFVVPRSLLGAVHCPFGQLSALAQVPDFGVLSLHQKYTSNVTAMAGKGFVYQSKIYDDWRTRDVHASDLALAGPEARFEHYQKVLKNLVNGIVDESDRRDFMKRFLSEDFLNTL
jgi:hypothetical protein